jgi:hypothetical protein
MCLLDYTRDSAQSGWPPPLTLHLPTYRLMKPVLYLISLPASQNASCHRLISAPWCFSPFQQWSGLVIFMDTHVCLKEEKLFSLKRILSFLINFSSTIKKEMYKNRKTCAQIQNCKLTESRNLKDIYKARKKPLPL